MNLSYIFINLCIIFLIVLFVTEYNPKTLLNEKIVTHSEKNFYEKSDVGTDVFRLTADPGNDKIFYQEPNYFNPQDSLFLFKSDRDNGKEKIYLLNLRSGEIIQLRESSSFGHIPTWSIDGKEVYIGTKGEIIVTPIKDVKERRIRIPDDSWITFLHVNPSGDKIIFVEESADGHKGLAVVNVNGSDYKRLFSTDNKSVFYIDHPTFIDNNKILFLTRGKNRDFTGDYNKPYILDLNGALSRLPLECSHYDINFQGDKILCASEGYIINLNGDILQSFSELRGHGVWAPDGITFLMTGDPVSVSERYFGKIVIMIFGSNISYNLVSHESTYNSSVEVHIQPNAQFSRNGRYVIYESDRGKSQNSDLYLVTVPE